MSIILGVDTSSSALSLALVKNSEPLASVTRYVKNSHAEHITSGMKFLIESANIKISEITNVAVTTGPGSFTGLRIGVSFIKGMFISQEIPVTAVSSLEVIATSATLTNGKIIVGIDARQNRVFCAEYKVVDGITKQISDDIVLNLEEFKKLYSENITVIYDTLGNSRCRLFDFLNTHKKSIEIEKESVQRGITVALIGNTRLKDNKQWSNPVDILPNYMQVSYAEKMKQRLGK